MKLLLIGFALMFSFLAEASPSNFPFLGLMPNLQKKTGHQEGQGVECSNFSGNWNGKCWNSPSESFDFALQMVQAGCSRIYINGLDYPIGGTSSFQTHDATTSANETVFINWAETTKKVLHLKHLLHQRPIGQFSEDSLVSDVKLFLLGETLKIGIDISAEKPNFRVYCEMHKNQ